MCNWNSNRYFLVLWPYILLHCTYIHVNMQICYKTAFAAQLSGSFGKDGLYYLYPWVMLHKCVCTHCNLLVLSQITMSTIFFACAVAKDIYELTATTQTPDCLWKITQTSISWAMQNRIYVPGISASPSPAINSKKFLGVWYASVYFFHPASTVWGLV